MSFAARMTLKFVHQWSPTNYWFIDKDLNIFELNIAHHEFKTHTKLELELNMCYDIKCKVEKFVHLDAYRILTIFEFESIGRGSYVTTNQVIDLKMKCRTAGVNLPAFFNTTIDGQVIKIS